MNRPYINTGFTPDRRSTSSPALAAGALWLRAGFIGASVLAISLTMLFTGEARPVPALASAIAGAVIAVFAWRRSWIVLNRADESPAARCVPARSGGFGSGAQSAALR